MVDDSPTHQNKSANNEPDQSGEAQSVPDEADRRNSVQSGHQDIYRRLARSLRRTHKFISEYSSFITGIATIAALGLTVLNTFYQSQLQAFVPALVSGIAAVMTSNATIVTLLLVLLVLQVYQVRLRRQVNREQDSEDMRTDGGSGLPQRDSQGRFVSGSSGPDLLMVLLAALAGFTAGSQFGDTEALIGAFVGVAVITFFSD